MGSIDRDDLKQRSIETLYQAQQKGVLTTPAAIDAASIALHWIKDVEQNEYYRVEDSRAQKSYMESEG